MLLKPLKVLSTANPNIQSDLHDPNNYCKSCNHTYKEKGVYRQHLRFKHGIQLVPLTKNPVFDPTMKADVNDPKNCYCIICKKLYATPRECKKHTMKHKMRGNNEPLVG